jgi:DNA-directed RNA polymerase omega subunit
MENIILRKALKRVTNRFELSVIAAERCRQLMEGATPKVTCEEGDPPTKIALVELAEGKVMRADDEHAEYRLAPEEARDSGGDNPQSSADPESADL